MRHLNERAREWVCAKPAGLGLLWPYLRPRPNQALPELTIFHHHWIHIYTQTYTPTPVLTSFKYSILQPLKLIKIIWKLFSLLQLDANLIEGEPYNPGLGIRSFAHLLIAHSLKIAHFNERLWAIHSDCSGQMSDCERLWAIPSGRSSKMSEWANHSLFWANHSFTHSFAKKQVVRSENRWANSQPCYNCFAQNNKRRQKVEWQNSNVSENMGNWFQNC